ncbi:hypothetical protein [Parabacteroides distasonis]|uniref:hypothetical protein n=1 Tax=Parabacteroides distasonis TaxID=823 RepID=UPI00189757AB|nr:hypothetical protein [Parabacteroides distasonis]MDB9190786.1 hypothetical protein [Parabacteroides distasonis]MDB9199648.1 hypothetical protein [Parabacteroides distasonis]
MTVREYQRSRDKKAWQHIEVVIMSRLDENERSRGEEKGNTCLVGKAEVRFLRMTGFTKGYGAAKKER